MIWNEILKFFLKGICLYQDKRERQKKMDMAFLKKKTIVSLLVNIFVTNT